jgi:potassium efflux system protein
MPLLRAIPQIRRLAIEKYKGEASGEKSETLGEHDALDVAKLSSQARAIVRLIMVVVVTGSLLLLWIDVLPVLGQLQRVELMEIGTEPGPDGTSVVILWLTLGDILVSALIFIATFLISRNLTGTLELVLLRRLPLSPGARYATESLAKYLVVIVGVVAGFDRLGIGWNKVQFLAAAITVGLGFGLQEIFANFVSGLIILFERPIRVGDTVTIGQITGEVSRIRMRATTVTDWDRKELIIPNREFVTGQVVNWTLSDSVMRARIKVGIAYGSDTAVAREILERVGRENPRVLRSPQLDVRFREFGDSSLNFELRVYVREIDDYIRVIDELHDAIDQGFRASGVEIAFPQRDLHLRTADATIEVKGQTKRSSRRSRIEELPDPNSV